MGDAFSDYLIDTINKGSLALMISIGTVLDFMNPVYNASIHPQLKKSQRKPILIKGM